MYEECVPTCEGKPCVLNEWQKLGVQILAKHIQVQKEKYFLQHPEIKLLLENFIVKTMKEKPKRDLRSVAAKYYNRDLQELQLEVKDQLQNYLSEVALGSNEDQLKEEMQVAKKEYLEAREALEKAKQKMGTPLVSKESSSFLSIVTSATTIPTPEEHTPVQTLSQELLEGIEHAIKVAGLAGYEEEELLYDAGYMFLKAAAERAMEIPVQHVKQDIQHMLETSLNMWEADALLKERIAQEEEWERRERKPYKKLRRMLADFKGYEPPDVEKIVPNLNDTPRKPPGKFNRYPRNVFGVYETIDVFEKGNITLSPGPSDMFSSFTIQTEDSALSSMDINNNK